MPKLIGAAAELRASYREVAQIHMQCMDQGFLSTLGDSFLALLYESIDANSNSALFIERKNGRVVGFVAGGRGMGTIYRQLLKRWPRLLPALLPTVFNPTKLKRICELIWFSRKQKPVPGCPTAELFSIAVVYPERGTGVAHRLYEELKEYFSSGGEKAFCIVVGDSLVSAHRFYLNMGAVPMAQICVHVGQQSTLYRQNC